MIRPNGAVRDHYGYDEYGVPAPGAKLSEDGRNVNHYTFGYTGEMWDEEDDLLYLRSRYYAPKVGRFMTRDAFPGVATNPLSMHKYTYVENSPVNWVDPLGFNKKDQKVFYGPLSPAQIYGPPNPYQDIGAFLDNWQLLDGYTQGTGKTGGSTPIFNPNPGINTTACHISNATGIPMNQVTINPNNPGYKYPAMALGGALGGIAMGGAYASLAPAAPAAAANADKVTQETTALQSYYPPNNGFLGTPTQATLQPGTLIDRFGYSYGSFASPAGTPAAMRALPPGTLNSPYNAYQVAKPIEVLSGKAAPWFGQPGLGIQYKFSQSIADLIESGALVKVGQ